MQPPEITHPPGILSPAGEEAGAATIRILVVEDEPSIRRICSVTLGLRGYEVVTAEDGEAGWAALIQGGFDLMMTDHDMPKLTGLALVRRARTAGITIPCLLVSGRLPLEDPDLHELVPPGFRLPKPFSILDLADKVAALVRLRVAA